MGTEKRDRQRENRAQRQAEAEMQRAAEQKAAAAKRLGYLATGALVVIAAVYFLFLRGDDENVSVGDDSGVVTDEIPADDLEELDELVEDESIDEPEDDGTLEEPDEEVAAPVDPSELFPPDGECPPADGSGERITQFDGPHPLCIDLDKTYTAEVVTNQGNFTIEFDTQRAPVTTNNFVTLARYRFYEGVNFHRVIEGFMIQGGDAVGTPAGTGGPGYQFADEPQGGEGPFYEIGSVAMANSGPNTNGSQFFVVTGASGETLPDQYTRFGTVTAGMETITAIEAAETDAGDAPVEPMTIESVTITES